MSGSLQLPVVVEEAGCDDRAIRFSDDRPISEPRKQQRVGSAKLLLAEGVPAVENHIPGAIQRVGIDERDGVIRGCETLIAGDDLRTRPADRKL